MIDAHFEDLEAATSTKAACELLGASRATRYRRRRPPLAGPPAPRPTPPNALTETECQHVLEVLRSPEYCDLAPAQIWARLLDEGSYLCSISTMYRLLAAAGENRERRRQRTHPAKTKPELVARRPNEVWSWDITKLRGPQRGVYYELFVIIDIYSRYVIAWTVAAAETGELAKDFIDAAITAQDIKAGQLAIHADRGTSMTSKPVAQLLVDLGVARSHSRPHVSNDNPYSEAQFKPSSTAPRSPAGSVPSKTPAPSAPRSSSTTTTSTATPASACTPPHRSTTTPPPRSGPNAPSPSTPPTPPTPPGSTAADPHHPSCPPSPGSTNPAEKHSSHPTRSLSHPP